MDEWSKMYRVMFKAPATTVTYVVEEVEASPCIQNGKSGWMVRNAGSILLANEFMARGLYEDFDDADLQRARWQQEQDAYQARKRRA